MNLMSGTIDVGYTVDRELTEFEDESLPRWFRQGTARLPLTGDPEMGLVERVDVELTLHGGLDMMLTVQPRGKRGHGMVLSQTVSRVHYSAAMCAVERFSDTFGAQTGHGAVCVLDALVYGPDDEVISPEYDPRETERGRAVVEIRPQVAIPAELWTPDHRASEMISSRIGPGWTATVPRSWSLVPRALVNALYATSNPNLAGCGYWMDERGEVSLPRFELLSGGVENSSSGMFHGMAKDRQVPVETDATALTSVARMISCDYRSRASGVDSSFSG